MSTPNLIGSTAEPALWATQGGGLACLSDDGAHVWYELPDWMDKLPDGSPDKAEVGDPIHPDWDLIPVNGSARSDEHDESYD